MVDPARHIQAMEKVGALVNVRERTRYEVRERLLKYGFSEEEAQDAVDTGVRCGLIDEERYTRAYIRGKTSSGWGHGKIVQRLRMAQVPEEVIERCGDDFQSEDEEYERALRELAKRSSSSSDPYASYLRRLVGKGYSYDIAKRAVKEHLRFLFTGAPPE